jgi:hypothetical protein
MRSPAWLVLALLLSGCEEQVIVQAPAPAPATPNSPEDPDVATFTMDEPQGTGPVVSLGPDVWSRNNFSFTLFAPWLDQPTSADVLLQIDPAAAAEVSLRHGGAGRWCNPPAELTATGNPGEWRIHRSPGPDDCTCPNDPSDWDWGPFFYLADLEVTFPNPGDWRVEVAPASATPVCDCTVGCRTDVGFSRGLAHVPAP